MRTAAIVILVGMSIVGLIVLRGVVVAPSKASSVEPSPAPTRQVVAKTMELVGWPCLRGPTHDSQSSETGLLDSFPATGPRELWRRDVGSSFSSPVVTDAGVIAFYRRGDQELIECLNPATGEQRWSFEYPTAWVCKYEYSSGPYSTPVIDGEVVFAVGAEGKLHALRIVDGTCLWQRDLKTDYAAAEMLFNFGASPLVAGERLFFTLGGTVGNSGIVCLDKRTGETLWTATDHEAGYATPTLAAVHGREYLFVFNHVGLAALDPETGKVYWETPFHSRAPDTVCATSPVVSEDLVMVTLGPAPGALCVRVLPDGSYEEVWRERRVIDSTWNNIAYRDGYAFGYTSKRIRSQMRSIDLRSGKVLWQWESDLERGSVLAADGKLIAFGEHGHLALLRQNPHKLEVLAATPEPIMQRPCYPMPALHRGLLYLKDEKSLACFDFRK